jgi:hypothetical protein
LHDSLLWHLMQCSLTSTCNCCKWSSLNTSSSALGGIRSLRREQNFRFMYIRSLNMTIYFDNFHSGFKFDIRYRTNYLRLNLRQVIKISKIFISTKKAQPETYYAFHSRSQRMRLQSIINKILTNYHYFDTDWLNYRQMIVNDIVNTI